MALIRRPTPPVIMGLATLLVLLAAWSLLSGAVRDTLRERALDLLLPQLILPRAVDPLVVIVDVDRASLARFGAWPWPRRQLAEVVAAAAEGHPAVLALDMLLAGPDRFSTPPTESGDEVLAKALSRAPSLLGFVLETHSTTQRLPITPILARSPVSLPDIWRADGVAGPVSVLTQAAQGFGALVVAADIDGPIRRVPLLVITAGTVRAGLALEAVRIAQGAGAYLIDTHRILHVGNMALPLGDDAALRLIQPPPEVWASRTISAGALIDDPAAREALKGRFVIIGASAPELGGLVVTPASPATPSVHLQAEAIDSLMSGRIFYRPAWLHQFEPVGAALIGLLCVALAVRLSPAAGTAFAILACVAWTSAALAAVRAEALLVDPAGPILIALAAFAVTSLVRFVHEEWRARLLRASFEQHLAPDVVRRIAENPSALRLRGEMREITALFTDIEGFTSMTERAEPRDLVALLDAYFDVATRVVTDHGGMIDKIVGDAVHAIFNAPFSLENHPQKAVSCALALLEESELVRRSPLGARLRLGRTRIGLETGPAIVGDVGGSRKLDYTAHGNAMNDAARLEALNKELGSSICVGPGTASRIESTALKLIATRTLRGHSQPIDIFTPASLPYPIEEAGGASRSQSNG